MAGDVGEAAVTVLVLALEFPAPLTAKTVNGNESVPGAAPAKSIVIILTVPVEIAAKSRISKIGAPSGVKVPVFTLC